MTVVDAMDNNISKVPYALILAFTCRRAIVACKLLTISPCRSVVDIAMVATIREGRKYVPYSGQSIRIGMQKLHARAYCSQLFHVICNQTTYYIVCP